MNATTMEPRRRSQTTGTPPSTNASTIVRPPAEGQHCGQHCVIPGPARKRWKRVSMIRRGCRHPTHVELSQCDQTVLPRSINTPTIQFGLILMMRRPAAALTTVSRKPECPQPAHTDTDTAIKPISISLRDFWAGSGLTRGVREPTGESDRTSPVQGGFTIWWKSKHVAGRRAARRHKKAFTK